jgi:hypothetical protein
MAGLSLLTNPAEAEESGNQKMALKIYTKADDVPEGLRGEYKQSGSVWVPDLSDDHPVLALNKTLIQEKQVEEAKVKKLRSDLDDALEAAKTSGVPRGQALVSKADAEALNGYKALGTPDELSALKTEHGTLKEDSDKRKRDDSLVEAAGVLGYNPDAFKLLRDLPDFEVRGEGDKRTVVAKVKDGDKVIEKPAKEFIESGYAASMPALTAKAGVKVSTAGGGSEPANDDGFQWARDFSKQHIEQTKPVADPFAAFQQRQSA